MLDYFARAWPVFPLAPGADTSEHMNKLARSKWRFNENPVALRLLSEWF
jgi:hypothetical protein